MEYCGIRSVQVRQATKPGRSRKGNPTKPKRSHSRRVCKGTSISSENSIQCVRSPSTKRCVVAKKNNEKAELRRAKNRSRRAASSKRRTSSVVTEKRWGLLDCGQYDQAKCGKMPQCHWEDNECRKGYKPGFEERIGAFEGKPHIPKFTKGELSHIIPRAIEIEPELACNFFKDEDQCNKRKDCNWLRETRNNPARCEKKSAPRRSSKKTQKGG